MIGEDNQLNSGTNEPAVRNLGMLFSTQFGLTVDQMHLYSTELVGIHPLLALSITIGPNILFSVIVHSLE